MADYRKDYEPVVIEDGIPLPQPKALKYPWKTIRPGQSFLIPEEKYSALRSSLAKYREWYPEHCLTVTTQNQGDGTIRVWCTNRRD